MVDLNASPDKLRKSILQEAMQGKLTEQLSEDGNAYDLLQSIAEEKQRLLQDGKIKKQKQLAAITDDEIPFNIPDNWNWSRLGSLVDINSGLSYKKSNLSNYNSDIRIIRGGNISNNYDLLLNDNDYRINDKFIKDSKVFLKENQLIMPVSTSPKHTAKVAIVPHIDSKIAAGGFIYQITSFLYENVLSKFLMYDLSCASVNKSIKDSTRLSGSALCNLPKTKLRNIVVPIPPLNEQKRIVAKLDNILPKVNSFKQSVDHIQTLRGELPPRLRRSFLQEAMQGKLTQQLPEDGDAVDLLKSIAEEKQRLYKTGKIKKPKQLAAITDDEIPFKIPDNWKWVRLSQIGYIISGGTPRKSNNEYWNSNDIPWLTPKFLGINQNHKILNNSNQYISYKGLKESSAQLIPKGSIIYSSRAPIGHINIVNFDYTTNQGAKSVMPFKVNNLFLYYALKQQTSIIKQHASGTTFKEISKSGFSKSLIPLPPLKEQYRIVKKLVSLFSKIDEI